MEWAERAPFKEEANCRRPGWAGTYLSSLSFFIPRRIAREGTCPGLPKFGSVEMGSVGLSYTHHINLIISIA